MRDTHRHSYQMVGSDQTPVPGSGHTEPVFEVHACSQCDRTAVVLDPERPAPRCHEGAMREVGTPDRSVTRTELVSHLADAFGVPRSGSDVCYALVASGVRSAGELADRLDRDHGAVTAHLDRLVAAGLLDRTTLPREGGGTVAAYHPTEDQTPPATLTEFCRWASRAAGEPIPDPASGSAGGNPPAAFREAFCPELNEQSASC